MKEEFLYFVWKNKLFDTDNFYTTNNQKIKILDTGKQNIDNGPDFVDCKLIIDGQLWAGAIEIHIRSSDWNKHKHFENNFYNSVVLHIVAIDDGVIKDMNGREVYTAVLKFNQNMYERYLQLVESSKFINCHWFLKEIKQIVWKNWLNRLLVERLEAKTEEIEKIFRQSQLSFEETFYKIVMQNIGLNTNKLPFEMLANHLPYKIIAKHRDNLLQIEALLFGQAGFLDTINSNNEYVCELKREYNFLKTKYQLNPIDVNLWKYSKLRPASYPTLRISQIASFFHQKENPFDTIIKLADLKQIRKLFDVEISAYWLNHIHFGKEKQHKYNNFGKIMIDNLLINTVCRLLFAYGHINNKQKYKDLALEFLQQIEKEDNKITREFAHYGIKAENAFHSQALIELANRYCAKDKCLDCVVGYNLIIRI